MKPTSRRRPHLRARSRGGSILLEFALVSIVLYVMLAGMLSFGRMYYSIQTAQMAADMAARELSRMPLAATATFEQVRDNPLSDFSTRIYSEDFLAIDIGPWISGPPQSLFQYLDSLNVPIVNRMLVPVMTISRVGGGAQTILRMPGALVTSPTAPSGLTVEVPLVVSRDGQGHETIVWQRVLEEIGDDPFPINSPEQGLVALQLNFAFQAAESGNFRDPGAGFPFEPNYGFPNEADDSQVTAPGTSTGGTPVAPDEQRGAFTGIFGLGQISHATVDLVRPYRKVVTSNAIYRREIFQ